MSCGVGCRGSSDLAWLWLWLWLAVAALIGPLAWEPPYAVGVAIKSKKKSPGKRSFLAVSTGSDSQAPEGRSDLVTFHLHFALLTVVTSRT